MTYARSVRGALLLAVVFSASAAWGDSECVKGDRPTTAAERQAMLTAQQAAKAALPAAPTGWAIGGYEEFSTRDNICRDFEGTPWAYNISRTFNRTDDVAERDQAMADAGTRARAAQAARQPRIDALMAQGQKLGAELGVAAQKGDQARIAAINREMEKLSKDMQAIYAEGDDQAIRESVAKATMEDRSMKVAVSINSGGYPDSGAKRATAPTGAHSAYPLDHDGRRRERGTCAGALRQLAAARRRRSRGATARHRLPRRRACDGGPRGRGSRAARLADGLDRLRRARGHRRALTRTLTKVSIAT